MGNTYVLIACCVKKKKDRARRVYVSCSNLIVLVFVLLIFRRMCLGINYMILWIMCVSLTCWLSKTS